MKIVNKNVNELIPYINNTRTHDDNQINQIISSIKEFGFTNPLLIDSENGIIAGHGRLTAAKKYGMKEVPCIVLEGLTEAQKKAYVIADNKLALNAGWDEELLKLELETLQELDFDIDILGFDDKELDNLLKIEEEVVEDDFDEEPPENPKSKRGDIWLLGRHRLMCGDSTSEDVDVLINGKPIDLVHTDAPYGISIVDSKTKKVGAENLAKNKQYLEVKGDDSTETAKLFYEKLRSKTSNFIMWGGNYFLDFLPFSSSFIVWDKRGDMNSNNFADGEIAWLSFHSRVRIYKQIWNGMIREGEKENRIHPTQKPIRMQSEILKDFSNENNNIFDGFGGSGSTLLACEVINRNCYMIEYESSYTDLIVKRYANFKESTDDIKLLRDGKEYTYSEIMEE